MQSEERDLRYSVRRGDLRAPHREEQRNEVLYRRKGIAVSRGQGIEVPDCPVTMQKVFPVLALIAFACDISRDALVHGDSARKPEAAGRNGGYEYQVIASSCPDEHLLRTRDESVALLRVNETVYSRRNLPSDRTEIE